MCWRKNKASYTGDKVGMKIKHFVERVLKYIYIEEF